MSLVLLKHYSLHKVKLFSNNQDGMKAIFDYKMYSVLILCLKEHVNPAVDRTPLVCNCSTSISNTRLTEASSRAASRWDADRETQFHSQLANDLPQG